MNESKVKIIYQNIFKNLRYIENKNILYIEKNTTHLQHTEQYLIKATSSVDDSVVNAIFTPLDSNPNDYSLNISCEGIKALSIINTFFGKLHFEKVDEIVQAYIQTGLSLNLIKDVSYPAHVMLSWFYTHQTVYQSFGEYYHSIYRDYNKRLVKVSFYDESTQKESKPLKLTANLNFSIIKNKLVPTVVLSIPFIKNKNRMEVIINLNDHFDINHYRMLFEEEFKKSLKLKKKIRKRINLLKSSPQTLKAVFFQQHLIKEKPTLIVGFLVCLITI